MVELIDFEVERDEPIEYQLSAAELSQAVLYNTDWTVETAISQMAKNNISLTPSFQRRDAWRIEKKSRFIESILLGLPVPQIVLAEDKDLRGQFVVLDGKQRLLTLLQFAGEASQSQWNKFKLRDLQFLTPLDGKTFVQLQDDAQFSQHVRAFWNYPIRSSVIRNWPNSRYLETVFVRLNEGSLKLSPQELRQAMSPGPFSEFIEEFTANSLAIRRLLHNDAPDFRMRDSELMLRFLAFALFPEMYAGDMKAFLDDVTTRLNLEWKKHEHGVRVNMGEIDDAVLFGLETIGDAVFARKWDRKLNAFSPYLNRAVAEIEIYYLRDKHLRDWVESNREHFIALITSLIGDNDDFRAALESTTKSMSAVENRFRIFGEALGKIVPSIRPLRIVNGRLMA